jgi:hypothetical protein
MKVWGIGVVQNFAASATDLYLAYRHFDAELSGRSCRVGQVRLTGERLGTPDPQSDWVREDDFGALRYPRSPPGCAQPCGLSEGPTQGLAPDLGRSRAFGMGSRGTPTPIG